jgi:hypothetical protein
MVGAFIPLLLAKAQDARTPVPTVPVTPVQPFLSTLVENDFEVRIAGEIRSGEWRIVRESADQHMYCVRNSYGPNYFFPSRRWAKATGKIAPSRCGFSPGSSATPLS